MSEMERDGEKGVILKPLFNKRETQSKKFCLTLNNYMESDLICLISFCKKHCSRYVIGKEIGESGTPHLQIALHTHNLHRFTSLKSAIGINTIHIEKQKAKLDKQSFDYCMKDGDYIGTEQPPYKGEDLPRLNQLNNWQLDIISIIKTKPNSRTVNWFWEDIGNTGKTTFCKYLCFHHKAVCILKGDYKDIMNHVFMQDDANLIIIDIPRDNGNKVSYNAIESIKGGIIVNMKYETGQKLINPPHIFIFANAPPDECRLSRDRWNIVNINEQLNNEIE
nr:MAG: replication associated protein [Cressdnaviricota sp.]